MITTLDRQMAIQLIDEARCAGACESKACEVLGLTCRTLRRWREQMRTEQRLQDRRKDGADKRGAPTNALTESERQQILDTCNQPEFQSLPPSQIVPILADRGVYMASESSMYRILKEANQLHHRSRSKAPEKKSEPRRYCATGPNELWSWDITFLRSTLKGDFYKLYMIEDIFSRKIVGWEVHREESSEHASALVTKACLAERIRKDQLKIHSDNGSPMKGGTMLATLQKLGVIPSFSRPSVSNDNAYSESLFRTLKYTPAFPTKPFESLEAARAWVHKFVSWYNHQHRHSGIRYVTPHARHTGQDQQILEQRHHLYEQAKAKKPERWSGKTRNWDRIDSVWLNPRKDDQVALAPDQEKLKKAA